MFIFLVLRTVLFPFLTATLKLSIFMFVRCFCLLSNYLQSSTHTEKCQYLLCFFLAKSSKLPTPTSVIIPPKIPEKGCLFQQPFPPHPTLDEALGFFQTHRHILPRDFHNLIIRIVFILRHPLSQHFIFQSLHPFFRHLTTHT